MTNSNFVIEYVDKVKNHFDGLIDVFTNCIGECIDPKEIERCKIRISEEINDLFYDVIVAEQNRIQQDNRDEYTIILGEAIDVTLFDSADHRLYEITDLVCMVQELCKEVMSLRTEIDPSYDHITATPLIQEARTIINKYIDSVGY